MHKTASLISLSILVLSAFGLTVACRESVMCGPPADGSKASCLGPDAEGGAGGVGGEGGLGTTGGAGGADASGDAGGATNLGGAASSACIDVMEAAQADDCDSGRVCNYVGYSGYCATGNPEATAAIFRCMRDFGGCHTPWDLGNSEVEACVNNVLKTEASSVGTAVRSATEKVCGETYHGFAFEMTAAMAGEAQAQALLTCVEDATDCDGAMACFNEAEVGFVQGDGC